MQETLNIFGFCSLLPPYEVTQEDSIRWLQAEYEKAGHTSSLKTLERYACGSHRIARRYFYLQDVTHTDRKQAQLFGSGQEFQKMGFRTSLYQQIAESLFQDFYKTENPAPDDIFHVTCTGYVAPSAAQKLVAQKGLSTTRVTHLYHMGCYAAFPALRRAFYNGITDIVHTELCSLHFDPHSLRAEQIVVNSLFADGAIKYSVGSTIPEGAYLELQNTEEMIIPATEDKMAWWTNDHGMSMSLDRQVPSLIAKATKNLVQKLVLSNEKKSCLFAIHPGGPGIIDSLEKALDLESWQTALSRSVLYERGNMSSATLPHIWQKILEEPEIPPETPVVSLAFGPGLTVCGSLMQVKNGD